MVFFLENGDIQYFPATSPTVSEITTDAGRMVVLQLSDNIASTSANVPPPEYATVQKF